MTQNIISLNITDPRGAGGHAMWTAFLVVLSPGRCSAGVRNLAIIT